MNQDSSRETQNLFEVVAQLVEESDPEGFCTEVPLCSNLLSSDLLETIRLGLQTRLVAVAQGSVPIVNLGRCQNEGESGTLNVRFIKSYVPEDCPLGWYVDVYAESCWYFKVSNKGAARELADFFNDPENRRKLEAVRPYAAVEEDALKVWLLNLRDKGIEVLLFGFKGTGQIKRVEAEMSSVS